jgi:hypothetical protein
VWLCVKVRDVGGCGFETKVVGGSVMGVVAADR